MKKSKKITLFVASLGCLAVSVGSALALSYQAGTATHTFNVDEAIYLKWGNGESSLTIEGVSDLVSGVKQYRFFGVQPAKSSGVEGTVTVSYKIESVTEDEKDYTLDGLTVNVYETTTLQETFDKDNAVLKSTITYDPSEKKGLGETTFEVGPTKQNQAFYALEFVYDGSPASGDEWGGKMTLSQDFAA